jgi:hypothetical protein
MSSGQGPGSGVVWLVVQDARNTNGQALV